MERKPRKASLETPKITIDDLELKKNLLRIGAEMGESIKRTVNRLVEAEMKKLFPGEYGEKSDRINKQRM